MWLPLLVACHAAMPAPPTAADGALQVAVTVDDVPYQTAAPGQVGVTDPGVQQRVNEAITDHLRTAGLPATAYVNCDHLDDATLLGAWKGFPLGNHTARHGDLHRLDRDDWAAEVRRCHARLEAWGHPPATFRYPYLHRGLDPATRDWGLALLEGLGERPAPVTVPTSEWLLAQHYDAATTETRRTALGTLYVQHMVDALDEARRIARTCRGADVPHITLLHANQLNADWLDDVLDAFEKRGFEVISLDEALAAPIYAEPDAYAGPRSLSWLGRVDPHCNVNWFGQQQTVLGEAVRALGSLR